MWFMIKAGQWSGDLLRMTPHIPDDKTRVLRAKLIFEECMETINALGVQIRFGIDDNEPTPWPLNDPESNEVHAHDFVDCRIDCVDIVEVVDGCCDIKVVTTGTLVAFSIADESHQEAIDNANLDKFGEGHY
ncbi:hypothetical protein KC906_00270, partial [Candidatus Kaiserbacteria bacterium]|nr:hypothetical protein [Candidatus Kaiserbacteria bacterium]